MEFDNSFREDFPFLSSLFPENNSSFPMGDGSSSSSSSSKALVHNFILNQQGHHPSLNNNNGSPLNNPPHHFHQFSIDGSSKNPFFEDSNTCTDPFNGFSNDLNACIPSLSFTVPDHGTSVNNGPSFQGCQTDPCWDFSQNKPSALPLLSSPETDDHHRSFQQQQEPRNFQDQPPRTVAAKVGDEVSCITADKNGHKNENNLVDENKNNNKNRFIKTKRVDKDVEKTSVIKGNWTPQEDRLLMTLVTRHGTKRWSQLAKLLNGRVGKQCRERWHNHLRPDIKKDTWSEEEDKILIEAHREIGNKWSEIAKRLPGRTENTIKNHWNATKRRQYAKRKRDGNARKGSLLQNYIRSVSSTTAGGTSSSRNDDANMVFESTNPQTNGNPYMVKLENSDFNSTSWNIEAINDHIQRPRQQQQQMDYCFDPNVYNDQRNHSCNASFGSILGEDSNPMENFELPLEMDSLRKEMDLIEMIHQRNL